MSRLVIGETCTVVPVREKDGSVRRVVNPATRKPLPPEGESVTVDIDWIRRDLDGDLDWSAPAPVESPEPASDDAPTDELASSAPKTNTRRARGDS